MSKRRTIVTEYLARVEGEGSMTVKLAGDTVEHVELGIFEPPRFFEAFLRGRQYTEPPDITARICGICPVAYQTSAVNAIESLCGVEIPEQIRLLRRLLYFGEWIESHALHVYMLHAPDFLGAPDVITVARAHRDAVERGLALKKAGNRLQEVVGGRAIHPVNVRVGGFYSVPTAADLAPMAEELRRALEHALATVNWVSGFDFPDLTVDHEFLALAGERYALEGGRIARSEGPVFPIAAFSDHVRETHVAHSTALHATLDGRPHLTGPMARYSLNHNHLSPLAKEAAATAGLGDECRNPFRSIVVRAVEIVYAVQEALRIIETYERPPRPYVDVEPRPGVGHGWSEAPRGLLYHRYEIDESGRIAAALIVPPTSQNQAAIEADLTKVVLAGVDLDDAALTSMCERAIRNYDPCISCATHFLTVTVKRR